MQALEQSAGFGRGFQRQSEESGALSREIERLRREHARLFGEYREGRMARDARMRKNLVVARRVATEIVAIDAVRSPVRPNAWRVTL